MSSCTVRMNDLCSGLIAYRSCLSTSVASYTKSSSLIYRKEKREITEEKGGIKRGVSQATNHQTIACLLNHFWACRLPVQAKILECQPCLTNGLQVFTSFVGVRVPKLDAEKSQWVVTTPIGLQVLISFVGV